MELKREDYLAQHIDELNKQIWLLEIDVSILNGMMKTINDKKEISKVMEQLQQIGQQIKGLNGRKQYIIKVLNGSIKMDDGEAQSLPTHTVSE